MDGAQLTREQSRTQTKEAPHPTGLTGTASAVGDQDESRGHLFGDKSGEYQGFRSEVLRKDWPPKGNRSDIGSPCVTRCAKEPRDRHAARQLTPGCLGQKGQPRRPTQFARELNRAVRKEGRVHSGQVNGH